MGRLIAIGDVHGCIEELENLLQKLYLVEEDQLVFLGDLLDKGPYSHLVVKRVRRLVDRHKGSVLIKGNHEEKNERFRSHLIKGNGRERTMKNHSEMLTITANLNEADVDFLNKAKLFVKNDEYNILAVHAGVAPSITYLPSDKELRFMSKKKLKHFQQMLRVRYVNPKGYMVMLGTETESDSYWADIYDGRFGTVLFGHQPFVQDGPRFFSNAIGIDLGCVFGGKLCAYVFDGSDRYAVTVQGKKYAEPYTRKSFMS